MFIISLITLLLIVFPLTPSHNLIYFITLLFLISPTSLYLLISFSSYSLYSISSLLSDNVTLLLVYTTLFLIITSLVSVDTLPTSPLPTSSLLYSFFFLYLSSFIVFSSSNIFLLYIFYESSLVPISYIILNWGTYPDRGYSGLIILLFTSVFTFPLSILLLYLNMSSSFNSFVLSSFIPPFSFFFSFWILLSFSVNLPLYGLHFWLPIAHVEAPTFGSIILAGLLLNIGGCGLLRLYPLILPSLQYLGSLLSSYLFFSILLSSFITTIQSDFNRLVAYSSVVHISLLVLILLIFHPLNSSLFLIIIIFHAFSSPVLFFLVGTLYSLLSTRQLFLLRGVLFTTPLLSFIIILIFIINVPVPPIPSFISEVFFFIGVYSYSSYLLILPLVLIMLVMVYSLSWLVGSLSSPSVVITPLITTPSLRSYLIIFSYIIVISLITLLISLF